MGFTGMGAVHHGCRVLEGPGSECRQALSVDRQGPVPQGTVAQLNTGQWTWVCASWLVGTSWKQVEVSLAGAFSFSRRGSQVLSQE